MKKYFKTGLLILLAIFVILQFFRPTKNINKDPQPNNIAKLITVNDTVNNILKKACYDCHTNNTQYPWYAEISPVNWFLNNHVKEGKQELNFDEFATYKPKRALKKLEEIADEVEHGAMPLNSYTWIHKDAKLTAAEKDALIKWANNSSKSLAVKYNDTLVK